jgi:two-component system, LytTR family, sensor kinase
VEEKVFFNTSLEFSLFYERTALLVCWSLLYVGIKQMRDGMERELRLSLVESEKRGAELKLLRAQMNPHFLFNSLTSIEAGMGKQLPNVRGMVQALADYLHYSLTHRNDDFVPMGEEYGALMGYLTLEKARLDGKLNIDCQIDNEARKALVPGIILQPLVENASNTAAKPRPLHCNSGFMCFASALSSRWKSAIPDIGTNSGLSPVTRQYPSQGDSPILI